MPASLRDAEQLPAAPAETLGLGLGFRGSASSNPSGRFQVNCAQPVTRSSSH